MKFNWGTGIAIFYSLFVIAMVSMVFKSCNNKSDLVEEEYYQKDLGYEEFRIKRANADKLKSEITANYISTANSLMIIFPRSLDKPKGEIKLYRPSNKFLDKTYIIRLDSTNTMNIPMIPNFSKGLWKVQLDWKSNGTPYYKEIELNI